MSWGYVAVAGATLISGKMSADAARKSGQQQARGAEAGIAEQRRQFDVIQEQMAPFREAGVSALGQQQALLGLGTPDEQAQAMAAFQDTPGQQFLRQQQERSLLRNAAAIGGLGGGNIRTALQQQAFGRAATQFGQQFNRLGALSGSGQTATQNLGQFGMQTAGNIANLQTAAGQARASGTLGAQQAQAQTIQQLGGLAAQSGLLS
jgi:hypothetical protein